MRLFILYDALSFNIAISSVRSTPRFISMLLTNILKQFFS